jgi:ornithine carbamoyltransferase
MMTQDIMTLRRKKKVVQKEVMAISMKGKSLASLYDLTREEIEQIFKKSELLKLQLLSGQEHHLLKGKTLAMIFEKPSTRTRVSFEVGMWQLGGYALYLGSISLGRRDHCRHGLVRSRYADGSWRESCSSDHPDWWLIRESRSSTVSPIIPTLPGAG